MTNQKSLDKPSVRGIFGWEKIGNEGLSIPVIVRNNDIRYTPVRIVEQEIIKKFDSLPQGVFKCITLKSFYLTPSEAKLLNLINFNHCNSFYGDSLFTPKDVIISANDIKDLLRFLNITHRFFNQDGSAFMDKFGVVKIQINPENPDLKLRVPYLGKIYAQNPTKSGRFIPFKLVEHFLVGSSTSCYQGGVSDWDIMYLKMLAIYSNNNISSHISRDSSIVFLDDLKYTCNGQKVIYEDYVRAEPNQA